MVFPTDVDGTWVNPGSVQLDAGELRRADATAFAGEGDPFGVHGGVTRHGDTSMTVTVDGSDVATVQAGAVVIPGNAAVGTGPYRFAIGASISGSLAARHASLSRIDLVVARQMDTDVVGTHGAYTGRIDVITGTPSSTPGVPTLPSMAVELARITVPATGGGTATVDLSHRRYAAAAGGEIPVPNSGRLPTAAAVGQRAIALDTLKGYLWNGSSWQLTRDPSWIDYSGPFAWTPSSGTAPSLGNGTLMARYRDMTGLIKARFRITFGSTTSRGNGPRWDFGLPVPEAATYGNYDPLGLATIVLGGEVYSMIVRRFGAQKCYLAWAAHDTSMHSPSIGAGDFNLSTGDIISAVLEYEPA